MAVADTYPPALFEIFKTCNELARISDRCLELEGRLSALGTSLAQNDMTNDESDAFWGPFFAEVERREREIEGGGDA